MKKIIAMELCLALALSLFGCAAKPTEILKEPPVLTIVCGDKNVEALKGTTSWTYQNEDGTSTGFEADCLHPLQAKGYMTPLALSISSGDPLKAYLQWGTIPDNISVRCWNEEYWGQPDAESMPIPIEVFETETTNGSYSINCVIELKDGNYIYEIKADWNNAERYGGTAYYSFYTTDSTME